MRFEYCNCKNKDADKFVAQRQQSSQKAHKKQEPRGGQTTEALIEFIETWSPQLDTRYLAVLAAFSDGHWAVMDSDIWCMEHDALEIENKILIRVINQNACNGFVA